MPAESATSPLSLAARCWSFGKRALAYAGRRRREAGPLYRGWRILRRYTAHYAKARRAYRRAEGRPPARSVYDVGVAVIRPDTETLGVRLPPHFLDLVAPVARAAADALDLSERCIFYPAVPAEAMATRSADVAAVAAGQVISIRLRDPLVIPGIAALSDPILEQLEREVYGCYLLVDKVYVYRSPICTHAPKASWLWHFDNHPREMLKVMVCLTDVTAGTAPCEYLRDAATGRTQIGSPLAPLAGDSRVPLAQVERQMANGFVSEAVTGPAGTVLVFDDNVVHRGTLATTGHRDVIVFQIRPSLAKAVPRIDPRWTGSVAHRDFNVDPWQLAPTPRKSA
jgi:hypothetical protein